MSISTTKNIRKYESYKYGFEKINSAIEAGFYLEAITFAESIISDRLLNYLVYRSQFFADTNKLPDTRTSFANLIKLWRKIDRQVVWKEREDLISDIDRWRNQRNECAHGLAKSTPGHPTKPVEEFIVIAHTSAVEGKFLANSICNWTQKQKRIMTRLNSVSPSEKILYL